jgi:hypothetical protein
MGRSSGTKLRDWTFDDRSRSRLLPQAANFENE